jgi:hypothetical protein
VGGWETGKNGKHRGTEGTEKRGREEGKRGEERGEKRSAPNAFSLPVALGLGELGVFAVSLEPTGRLAPFRLHFSKGWWAMACGGY